MPDHQEVYIDADGLTSIVVDILERPSKDVCSDDEQAILYHLKDVTSDRELSHTKIWKTARSRLDKIP